MEEDERGYHSHHHHHYGGSSGGMVYFLGFIGAIFYYFQNSVVFSDYAWGVVKSLVWPALLVFKIFSLWKI